MQRPRPLEIVPNVGHRRAVYYCLDSISVAIVGVRRRHAAATQLLNAGCRITSIQKFLGHKRLNTTLTYARAHDQTVADDYYAAMRSVEQRLDLAGQPVEPKITIPTQEREQLLALAEQLSQPEVSQEVRLDLAMQLRLVLTGNWLAYPVVPTAVCELALLDHSPPLGSV